MQNREHEVNYTQHGNIMTKEKNVISVTVWDFVVDAVAVDWAVVVSPVVDVAVPVTVLAFVVDAVAVDRIVVVSPVVDVAVQVTV